MKNVFVLTRLCRRSDHKRGGTARRDGTARVLLGPGDRAGGRAVLQRRDASFTEIDFAGLYEKLEPDYGADTSEIIETYRKAMPEASAPEIFVAVASINMMGLGSIEIAEKKAM